MEGLYLPSDPQGLIQGLAWVRHFVRNCVTVCTVWKVKLALALDLFFVWSWENKANFLKVKCCYHRSSAHAHPHITWPRWLFVVSWSEHIKVWALDTLCQYLMDWIFSFRYCLLLFQSKAEVKSPLCWGLFTAWFLRPRLYFLFIKILVFHHRSIFNNSKK